MSSRAEQVTAGFLRSWPLPDGGESKHDRGSILVVGGSRKSPGAAVLAGRAALRVGGGRLTLAVAESVVGGLPAAIQEAGLIGLAEGADGLISGRDAEALDAELNAADAVLIGSGLQHPDEAKRILSVVARQLPAATPVVLDAFALGVLPRLEEIQQTFAGRLVLTPNREEAARLLGEEIDGGAGDEDAQRAGIASIAERYGAVVSCYGVIAAPDGSSWRVDEGGPGLGTSGSGDVLAGATAGLVARGAALGQAACWATYLHARAGDRLAARIGALGFLAGEIADELPRAAAEVDSPSAVDLP